jgi:hypothetical protein
VELLIFPENMKKRENIISANTDIRRNVTKILPLTGLRLIDLLPSRLLMAP